jgi:putative transposase
VSRQARIVVPDVPDYPHHLVLRANNRRRLFSYPSDYLGFLRYLEEALERTDVVLHALTLMTNHVHMIVRAPGVDVMARFVKLTAQRYAQRRNRERTASGKLFEARYWSDPIVDDEQLAVVTYYSDVNALRAGLVDDPADHRWSTYAIHAGQPERSSIPMDLWTPSPWYLALASTAKVRASRYRERVSYYLERHTQPKRMTAIRAAEALSASAYGRRLERPDGTQAKEDQAPYGEGGSLVAMTRRVPRTR